MREARIAGWKVAWHQELTQEHAETLIQLEKNWDYFRITWRSLERERHHFDLLKQAGYQIFETDTLPQYVIDLSEGFEAYLKSLSHNARKAFKKKVRLGAPLEPHLRPVAQKDEIRPFFEELFTHHIPYWTEKTGYSYFTIPAEREFTITWSEQLFEQGFLRLDRLIMDGKTANLSMGIVMGDTFYWILTINNNAFNTYSPGMIGLAFRLEALAAQGIRQFNMGAGDFFYKIQSASYQEACKDSIVFNMRSFKGRLYRAWFLKRHPKAVQV